MVCLDDVLREWKQDCVIDKVMLDETSMKTPCLHSKYLDYLVAFKKQKRELAAAKRTIPAVEKRDNPRYKEIEELLFEAETGIETCSEIIQSINQRNWTIKGIIDWRKFVQGVDV